MIELLEYFARVLPGCLLLIIVLILLPKTETRVFKIFLLIMGFILIRDAMTPVGFWQLGLTRKALWIRFHHDPLILLVLGIVSVLLTFGIIYTTTELRSLLKWSGDSTVQSILTGIAGAFVIICPSLLPYAFIDISERGGNVAVSLIFPLLLMTLAGNFMEEVLFRGYLQGYLEKITGTIHAAILSGLIFSAGHAFLATTVTDLGWPILAYTFYIGIICALLRIKYGLISSTFAHGFGIFLLSAGIF